MADQKFGRNKRAPNAASQVRRTERNKRRNAERAHALKMQQPHAGQSSAAMYGGHQPRLDAARKFINICLNLGLVRAARRRKENLE